MKSRESTPTPRQREVENAPEEQEPVDPGNLLGRTDRVSHGDVTRLQDEVDRLQVNNPILGRRLILQDHASWFAICVID